MLLSGQLHNLLGESSGIYFLQKGGCHEENVGPWELGTSH